MKLGEQIQSKKNTIESLENAIAFLKMELMELEEIACRTCAGHGGHYGGPYGAKFIRCRKCKGTGRAK